MASSPVSARRSCSTARRWRPSARGRGSPNTPPKFGARSAKGYPFMTDMKSEIRGGMRIDWDAPIAMDDGVVLRADVFRPVADGHYPVILSYGPYRSEERRVGKE